MQLVSHPDFPVLDTPAHILHRIILLRVMLQEAARNCVFWYSSRWLPYSQRSLVFFSDLLLCYSLLQPLFLQEPRSQFLYRGERSQSEAVSPRADGDMRPFQLG